jgi:hypothetical protein
MARAPMLMGNGDDHDAAGFEAVDQPIRKTVQFEFAQRCLDTPIQRVADSSML